MPQAIVHIGFNKCGSTAIQTWLADNVAALADQGFAYRRTDPRADVVCTNPQFAALACTLADRDVWPREMNAVLGITEGDRSSQDRVAHDFAKDYGGWAADQGQARIIVSNESLAARLDEPGMVRALDQWFRDAIGPVRYIAYIREPVAWTISLYGHAMRRQNAEGRSLSLPQRLETARPAPFGPALRCWLDAVPAERLDVRLFNEDWLSGAGLIEDFSAALAVDPRRTRRSRRIENGTFRRSRWFDRFRKIDAPQRPRPDAALRAKIRARHAADMDWIEQTFFAGREQSFRSWLTADQPDVAQGA